MHQIRLKKYGDLQNNQPLVNDNINLSVSTSLNGNHVLLTINAKSNAEINKLQIVVNGCPFKVDKITPSNTLHQTINIPLNAGNNNIYTWVEDTKGYRSNFDEQRIVGEFPDSGKWYFIGIGVSAYKDSTYNLKYADKDIRDIAEFLSKKYKSISIDTLLNSNATVQNIKALSEKLKHTNPNDKIMISFSGHGLLDNENKFWFATHDINFRNPKQNGFSMESIAAMLDDVPARYRLITLDACHSGDAVSVLTNTKTYHTDNPINKLEPATIKGIITTTDEDNTQSSSELLKSMQMVFTDQLSNTGINLIAASSGAEFALEGKDWANGVFTRALINGWWFGVTDLTHDDKVHFRNLKDYVQKVVSKITNGKQTPNTVMENGEIDWWLVK